MGLKLRRFDTQEANIEVREASPGRKHMFLRFAAKNAEFYQKFLNGLVRTHIRREFLNLLENAVGRVRLEKPRSVWRTSSTSPPSIRVSPPEKRQTCRAVGPMCKISKVDRRSAGMPVDPFHRRTRCS